MLGHISYAQTFQTCIPLHTSFADKSMINGIFGEGTLSMSDGRVGKYKGSCVLEVGRQTGSCVFGKQTGGHMFFGWTDRGSCVLG